MSLTAIIAVFVTLVIVIPLSYFIALNKLKKDCKIKIEDAQKRANQIIDSAIRAGEDKKYKFLIEAKEESIQIKHSLDQEIKERRAEIIKLEQCNKNKEHILDTKVNVIEKKEQELNAASENLKKQILDVEQIKQKHIYELEKISGITSEQAKQFLFDQIKDEINHDVAVFIREQKVKANYEADKKAKEIIISSIQRYASDFTSESTVSVVELQSDEMKGRIIGREGRNIRTIENATGVELIIDDTPNAVVLSSFDPIRREIARIALEKLIIDGRIHPGRIEDMVIKAEKEIDSKIRDKGDDVIFKLGISGVHPEIIRLLGRMFYRTSYGQNALQHSIEVAEISGLIAAEMNEDVCLAKRAGLLHDIGKSIDQHVEGSHIEVGVNICKKYKENEVVINAIESHHGDKDAESIIACIVQAADTISASRPGARCGSVENYINRIKQLEEIANSYDGVEKSFAIQAGREVRVMVVPGEVSDDDMVLIAHKIAKDIESNMSYPYQVKVNVIRETRVMDIAK